MSTSSNSLLSDDLSRNCESLDINCEKRLLPDCKKHFDIPVISSNVSYSDFLHRFLLGNLPCKIRDCIGKWRSRMEWVNEKGTPNFDFLRQQFGSCIVPVADCSQQFYNAHTKTEMSFSDYVDYWRKLVSSHHCYDDQPCLYLKDWHFMREISEYDAYQTPIYFSSDWLNEYLVGESKDDYRFVYMGPKGTWTPFHADVFGSFSWSANICGKKLWILFPPGHELYLKDKLGNLPHDLSKTNFTDLHHYPNAHRLESNGTYGIKVVQEAGEIVFIPSGWHHQVWNIEDTISINHNWFNGCNINIIWEQLLNSLEQVEKEIVDYKDMDGWNQQCQVILKVHHGMDFSDFFSILKCVSQRVLREVSVHKSVQSCAISQIDDDDTAFDQTTFDLQQNVHFAKYNHTSVKMGKFGLVGTLAFGTSKAWSKKHHLFSCTRDNLTICPACGTPLGLNDSSDGSIACLTWKR